MLRPWIEIIAAAVMFGGSPDPDLSRAFTFYGQTEYGRAIDALQALDRKDAAAYALLGKSYFMQGQYKQAVANLDKAVAEDSRNSEYYDWLGKAYGRLAATSSFLSAMGYAKKTVHMFERAVELGPSNLEALSDLFEYYLQAPAIVGGGLDKADAIARRFGNLNEAEYHWASARLAEKRKGYVVAEKEFRAAIAAAPDEAGRALDLAGFLSSRGRYGESEGLFRAAEERNPNSPKVLYARASAYIESKRKLDEAQALLRRYLELKTRPDDPTPREAAALLKQARSLESNGRRAEEHQRIQTSESFR
jgi:tetratricopeptide (TPR) repeat protein